MCEDNTYLINFLDKVRPKGKKDLLLANKRVLIVSGLTKFWFKILKSIIDHDNSKDINGSFPSTDRLCVCERDY